MTNLTHKPRPCTDKHIMNHHCNAPNNTRHCPLIRLSRQHLIREMINIFFCSFKRSWTWFYTIISIFLRRWALNRNVGRISCFFHNAIIMRRKYNNNRFIIRCEGIWKPQIYMTVYNTNKYSPRFIFAWSSAGENKTGRIPMPQIISL